MVVSRGASEGFTANILIRIISPVAANSDEVRENIFTPFFSTKKKLGTGIGLTMTSRIVRKHGGSIEVESELTRGTKFRVSLPVGGPSE